MIFVSDSHVCQNNLKNIYTLELFKSTVLKINNIKEQNIIFLGDNVQDGTIQNYDLLFDQISLIKNKNIYMMAGNHDDKGLLETYCNHYKIEYCLNSEKIIENQRYYFLDSNVANEDYGIISQSSLVKLEQYLKGKRSIKYI